MAGKIYKSGYPSVTTILNVLSKPGLMMWLKNNSREFCDAESNKGKEIGSLIHQIIQNHIEDNDIKFETQYPVEVENAVKSFFKFKKDYPEVKLKKSEIEITSEIHKYSGTLDSLAKIKDELVIFDYKTGQCKVGTKKETDIPPLYDEMIFQVSAYVIAYNEMMKTEIKKAYILVLAKDKVSYNSFIVCEKEIERAFNEIFLPALSIYRYKEKEGIANEYNSSNNSNNRQKVDGDSAASKRYSPKSIGLPGSF